MEKYEHTTLPFHTVFCWCGFLQNVCFQRLRLLFQATFDGENPECIVHSLFVSQKKLKKENGGIDVLSDRDVFNQSHGLVSGGLL